MDRKGDWGEDGSSSCVREGRLNDELKKWEKDDRLLLVDKLSTLLSNTSSSESAPSLWNEIQSSAGSFPCLVRSGFLGLLSGVFPGPALQTPMCTPDHFCSGFGTSSPLPFLSTDGMDGWMTHNYFSLIHGCSLMKLHAKGEDIMNELKEEDQ